VRHWIAYGRSCEDGQSLARGDIEGSRQLSVCLTAGSLVRFTFVEVHRLFGAGKMRIMMHPVCGVPAHERRHADLGADRRRRWPGRREAPTTRLRRTPQAGREKMAHEKPGQTLQATALVHEAYVRWWTWTRPSIGERAHFFAAAAEAMRRILIENAGENSAFGTEVIWSGGTFWMLMSPSCLRTSRRCFSTTP